MHSILKLRQHEVDLACRCYVDSVQAVLALREHGHLVNHKAKLNPTRLNLIPKSRFLVKALLRCPTYILHTFFKEMKYTA